MFKMIEECSEDEKRYLYGECDCWIKENFEPGYTIVALVDCDNRLLHCYFMDEKHEVYRDVRGESYDETDITEYIETTGTVTEYNFSNIRDFSIFIDWIDFEMNKEDHFVVSYGAEQLKK